MGNAFFTKSFFFRFLDQNQISAEFEAVSTFPGAWSTMRISKKKTMTRALIFTG
jgi:hypothetical protein